MLHCLCGHRAETTHHVHECSWTILLRYQLDSKNLTSTRDYEILRESEDDNKWSTDCR